MIIVLLLLLQLNFVSLNAVPTINDAADCSVSLVSELFKQPVEFNKRQLSIDRRYDGLITVFLHKISTEYFGASYEICFKEWNNYCLEVSSALNKDISKIKVPRLDELKQKYLSILGVVCGAWQKSSKDSHKNVLSIDHDENEWQLYVKPNHLLHQHSLINALAQKYVSEIKSIKHYQVSANVMNCSVSTDEKNLYLWIKKDCSEMVQSFFKFRIDD
jgi:hypothetical protein